MSIRASNIRSPESLLAYECSMGRNVQWPRDQRRLSSLRMPPLSDDEYLSDEDLVRSQAEAKGCST